MNQETFREISLAMRDVSDPLLDALRRGLEGEADPHCVDVGRIVFHEQSRRRIRVSFEKSYAAIYGYPAPGGKSVARPAGKVVTFDDDCNGRWPRRERVW